MLVLDPAVPVLTRSPDSVQFGIDSPVVLSGLTEAESSFLSALRVGIDEAGAADQAEALGADPERAVELVSLLRDSGLLLPTAGSAASVPWRMRTWALQQSADAVELSRRISASPVFAVGPFSEEFAAAAQAVGMQAEAAESSEDPRIRPGGLVILTSLWMPDLLSASSLFSRDVDHVHAVIGDRLGTLSGVVVPGATPCTECSVRWQKSRDPGWMSAWRAAHTAGLRPSLADPALVALTAAHAASRLRADRAGLPGARSRLLVSDWGIEEEEAAFHPDCACRQADGDAESAMTSSSSAPNCAVLTEPIPGISAS